MSEHGWKSGTGIEDFRDTGDRNGFHASGNYEMIPIVSDQALVNIRVTVGIQFHTAKGVSNLDSETIGVPRKVSLPEHFFRDSSEFLGCIQGKAVPSVFPVLEEFCENRVTFVKTLGP